MNNPNKIDQMKKNMVSTAISVLKIEDRFLVVGSSNGSVRFYDDQYRIEAWFEDIDLGSIHTISFSDVQEDYDPQESHMTNEKIKMEKPFECRDFIVVDDRARITLLKSSLFEKIERDEKKGRILLESFVAPIVCSAVRPFANTIIVSCENSVLYEWNFVEKPHKIQVKREFKSEEVPTCLNYSPKGKFLAVGTKIGTIHMYEV